MYQKGKSTVCAMIHPNTIIKESFEVLHTVEEMSMLADYIGSLDGAIRPVSFAHGCRFPHALRASPSRMVCCVAHRSRRKNSSSLVQSSGSQSQAIDF